ncbi:MAG: hypothetical protein A07HN63_00763 [uncultured archaeon A07HN63]|nr:MAG: hypothetical protein A07HN63_00763 [uncultured archaeon A07HN63]
MAVNEFDPERVKTAAGGDADDTAVESSADD